MATRQSRPTEPASFPNTKSSRSASERTITSGNRTDEVTELDAAAPVSRVSCEVPAAPPPRIMATDATTKARMAQCCTGRECMTGV